MSWIRSVDGIEVTGPERPELPSDLQRHPDTGEWTQVTPDNADQFGVYPVTPAASPGRDYVRSIVNGGPGVFDETWTFSQELFDANAAADAQEDTRDQAQRRHDWFRNRSSQWAAQPDPSTLADVVQLCTVMLLDFERIETQLADLVIASGSYDPNDQDPTGQTSRAAKAGDGLPGEPPAWAVALRELIEDLRDFQDADDETNGRKKD